MPRARAATIDVRRPTRRRSPAIAGALLACWLAAAPAGAAGGLHGTPFLALVDDLLARFHAVERPCAAVPDVADLCFEVRPGDVVSVAAALVAHRDALPGAIALGPWTSANGAHRVEIHLQDDAWGSVELWLVERPGHRVDGWIERLPRRRS